MRKFLVVLDDSKECLNAIRYAALRAANTGGAVQVLAVIPADEIQHGFGVAEVMRAEARERIKARLELARVEDQAVVAASMPRLLDLFQTYLREMRPEELRGSAGTYRLREELIARANIAVHPTRVVDVLFTELLVQ